MLVLVSYDVSTLSPEGQKRLRKIAKICENYGQRVQHSVFECLVTPSQWVVFSSNLQKIIDIETDSLRFYFLGSNWKKRVEHIGAKKSYDPEGLLVL